MILFVCVDFVHSVALTVHVSFEYSESVSPKRNADHAEYRPCIWRVIRLSLFFLALVCALNFDSHFFGSSYKIVFNISECVIYPPAAEAHF